MNKNYYKILGISKTATQSEIKKAYFAKAKMYHPDVCKDKNAEQMFKDISNAYETLKDENLRRNYDEDLKNNNNSHNANNTNYQSQQSDDINYAPLKTMFNSSSQDIDYFTNMIKNNYQNERDVANAYSFFWFSFWSGGQGAVDMLTNRSASKIFKAFCANPFMKSMKKSITREVGSDKEKIKEINELKKFIENMCNSVPDDQINTQNAYNWMIKTINDDNIFDDEDVMHYFLLVSNNIFALLDKFERIYIVGPPIRAKSHYSNKVRARTGGGIMSTILTIIGIIFLIKFLF